jgi:hypothetical protein
MLFPQVPSDFLQGSDVDLKINLGVISSSIKAHHVDGKTELPQKLKSVCQFLLETNQVNTIDSPKSYIFGTFPLSFGVVKENASSISFFGGEINGKKVGLIGAVSSLIGEYTLTESNHAPYYYTLKFLNQVAKNGEMTDASPGYHTYDAAFDLALKTVPNKRKKWSL